VSRPRTWDHAAYHAQSHSSRQLQSANLQPARSRHARNSLGPHLALVEAGRVCRDSAPRSSNSAQHVPSSRARCFAALRHLSLFCRDKSPISEPTSYDKILRIEANSEPSGRRGDMEEHLIDRQRAVVAHRQSVEVARRRNAPVHGPSPPSMDRRQRRHRKAYSSLRRKMPWPTPAGSSLRADWKAIHFPSGLTTGFEALKLS
jgi:hypothetical protein